MSQTTPPTVPPISVPFEPPVPQAIPTPLFSTPSTYIGAFSDAKLQAAIDRAGANLAPGKTRIILHADTDNNVYLSAVKKLGDHISVEGAVVLDTSQGWKFDAQHLSAEAQIVAEF